MAIQRTTISTSAHPTDRMPKKRKDQARFKASWTPNEASGSRPRPKPVRRQTSQAETPMRMKSDIQTGVKTQSGGLNQGLDSPWYQSDTEVRVIAPPMADTPRHSATQKAKPARSLSFPCGGMLNSMNLR